ncbi:uncharacterized protein VTP21DRAFT_2366 [Calcarisporiella thermophila]|uniref:uncharacterized protein n=1 Tax=Calcarisporiella thermophila TaxID=911321 RepID=UPI003742214D
MPVAQDAFTTVKIAPPSPNVKQAAPLSVHLDTSKVREKEDLTKVEALQRATNYLAAAMIFLQNNYLLERPLKKDDIKQRLLGHWGTCPGINLIYAHCNHLIKKYNVDMFLVTGPGHGAPANLANLYLEGSLSKFYPQYSFGAEGLGNLVKYFSWPGGFPSHTNSEVPGQIHEGGELGYALAVSFGAVMDNPDLIVTCIVGDGEAETGPTATAWHSYKFIDPRESGAVLPILHLNGFKISESTIFGCMDDDELVALFSGYGYSVRIVEDLDDINVDMWASLEWAYNEIRRIQKAAREDNQPILKPRWPMLILKTPKGWTGPKELDGKQIEGTFRAHQVPLPKPNQDEGQLKLLQEWLEGYQIKELFNMDDYTPKKILLDAFPANPELRMGQRKETYAGYRPLDLAEWKEFSTTDELASCMLQTGKYLADVIKRNQTRFRVFSPDEAESNKLNDIFNVTGRNFQWDPETANRGGRVLEVLSEHCCQGWLQGYTLTGRVGIFPSYESFLGIIASMMIQYAKFIKLASETKWRQPVASINLLQTSTLWRQEHNGFSHQAPSLLNVLINMKMNIVRVYFPPDANCFTCTISHCLRSKNYINLLVGSKNPTWTWLRPDEAEKHCIAGASVWKFCSVDEGRDPDVILVGCGVETTSEVIAAASMLRKDVPNLRVRVVNVTDLMILAKEGGHPHALSSEAFCALFTDDKPIVFNFHGYPSAIKQLVFDRPGVQERLVVHGYEEEGSTTTPFKMLVANSASRYHICIDAIRKVMVTHPDIALEGHTLITGYQHAIRKHDEYIRRYGKDPEYLSQKPRFE